MESAWDPEPHSISCCPTETAEAGAEARTGLERAVPSSSESTMRRTRVVRDHAQKVTVLIAKGLVFLRDVAWVDFPGSKH